LVCWVLPCDFTGCVLDCDFAGCFFAWAFAVLPAEWEADADDFAGVFAAWVLD
jgi:hypothetical protein